MDSDQRHLLSDSSRSALSLQDPSKTMRALSQRYFYVRNCFYADYIPDESERDSVFQQPIEDERVSLRSRSSSISTTTDDQASLLPPRRERDRLNSLERPPPASSSGQRRAKSAAVTSASGRRRKGLQPLGEELETIKSYLSLNVPRGPALGMCRVCACVAL